jgi:hypothetical protein
MTHSGQEAASGVLSVIAMFQQLHPLGSKRHRHNFLTTANLP